MKALQAMNQKSTRDMRVLAIDPASHSMALALLEKRDGVVTLLYAGKLKFPPPNEMTAKMLAINASLRVFFSLVGQVDYVVIEQSIYIQNPQTSRILSYLIGHIWGESLNLGAKVVDVPPLTWKAFIGYKRIMKKEKEQLIETMGKTEANKFINKEKKDRTKRIVARMIPKTERINDDDIIDAIGIGIWAVDNI